MSNLEIAKLFREVAAAFTIKDDFKYKFQIIAYQKAADSIEHASTELKTLFQQDRLEKIPGIGHTLEERLKELFKTGKVKHFEQAFEGISPAVFPLLDIPSFGPKKAHKLVTHFNLKNPKTVIEDIKKLTLEGKIAKLGGFGEKSQSDILQAINEYNTGTTKSGRMVLPYAFALAKEIVEYLKKHKDVIKVEPLGSLRRMNATVGDVDLAITSKDSEAVIDYFVAFPGKERIIERGPTTASILIGGGKHVDLLILPPQQFGSLLQHFTGSKHHNVALREFALKKRMSLSERGIKLLGKKGSPLVEFASEEKFYKYLGLDWIPPEIRENGGEIEAAAMHKLPELVETKDIKGDIHTHTNYPLDSSHDYGSGSMEEMIERAKELKYEYIGISDHNPSVGNHTKDEIYSILAKREGIIERLKKSNKNIRVINLLEMDILTSGELAVDEKGIEFVDALIVSIHSSFGMNRDDMTKRVLEGLSHPKAKILAHPTGRMINSRTGYQLNWEKVLAFCAKNNKALEINAWPERLDLPDALVRQAKEAGVKFVINTDSHAVSHMDNMFYGVAVARRGWAEKKDILNTLPVQKFSDWIIS
ncbi:MAG: PHP domain-containing protein [Candidatus Levyibacteriota bacterium]